jgi:hypothetical protein
MARGGSGDEVDLHLTHVTPAGAHGDDAETRKRIGAALEDLSDEPAPLELAELHGGSVARTLFEVGRDGGSLLVLGMRDARTLLHEGRPNIADSVARRACGPLLLVPEPTRAANRVRAGQAHAVAR